MEILNYQEQLPGSKVLAYFDLYIPALDMTFHKWRVMRSSKGMLFVNSPAYSEEDNDGKKVWKNYIEIGEKRRREFQQRVLEELKPFIS